MTGIPELRKVEDLQREVWGLRDLDIVPSLVLKASIAAGGYLIGAFDGEDLAGFVYAFVGIENGETVLHSDMLAIRASHRGKGLGRRLKLAQRESALSRGIRRITWTFDPLQSENAHLNFRRLGVTSDRYLDDFYGETGSMLHEGTATDRLWVSWKLDSQRVFERIAGSPGNQERPARQRLSVREDRYPEMHPDSELSEMDIALEIPSDFRQLTARDLPLAEAWRKASRRAFQELFARGYSVRDFIRGEKRGSYLLSRDAAGD